MIFQLMNIGQCACFDLSAIVRVLELSDEFPRMGPWNQTPQVHLEATA